MQVNPEDGPPEIYVTWSDPRMTDFEIVRFYLQSSKDRISLMSETCKIWINR